MLFHPRCITKIETYGALVKKQLAECLVQSRLDYNSSVLEPLPVYLMKRLTRVQSSAAGFVTNRYATEKDVIKLGWLPLQERREHNLLKLAHKALHRHSSQWSN